MKNGVTNPINFFDYVAQIVKDPLRILSGRRSKMLSPSQGRDIIDATDSAEIVGKCHCPVNSEQQACFECNRITAEGEMRTPVIRLGLVRSILECPFHWAVKQLALDIPLELR